MTETFTNASKKDHKSLSTSNPLCVVVFSTVFSENLHTLQQQCLNFQIPFFVIGLGIQKTDLQKEGKYKSLQNCKKYLFHKLLQELKIYVHPLTFILYLDHCDFLFQSTILQDVSIYFEQMIQDRKEKNVIFSWRDNQGQNKVLFSRLEYFLNDNSEQIQLSTTDEKDDREHKIHLCYNVLSFCCANIHSRNFDFFKNFAQIWLEMEKRWTSVGLCQKIEPLMKNTNFFIATNRDCRLKFPRFSNMEKKSNEMTKISQIPQKKKEECRCSFATKPLIRSLLLDYSISDFIQNKNQDQNSTQKHNFRPQTRPRPRLTTIISSELPTATPYDDVWILFLLLGISWSLVVLFAVLFAVYFSRNEKNKHKLKKVATNHKAVKI